MHRQKAFNTFRQTYPRFDFEGFSYDVQPDGLHIVFSFSAVDSTSRHAIAFHPSAYIPTRDFLHFDQPRPTLDALVFHIGMVELVSYWKCFCPPKVHIRCGSLDASQISFWKKLYWHGLGEFFYTNGITTSYDDFMSITSQGTRHALAQESSSTSPRPACLLPVGGGKDSVVSLGLLQQAGRPFVPLILNPRGATTACASVAGCGTEQTLVIQRTLDPTMLRLNTQGCLNGHTPFSALLAGYTLLAAQLSGFHDIVLSNENSANESTVLGTMVNHQYSKSLEFEMDFRNYVCHTFEGRYNYFSLLRPLNELQIALLFASSTAYHDVFRSCNVGSKQDVWCGHCAKCLFTYIILSPFISPQRLEQIFGRDLFSDSEMISLLHELLGMAESKPFECVGTVEEVAAAISLACHRWYSAVDRPPILQHLHHLPSVDTALQILDSVSDNHCVPQDLLDALEKRRRSLNVEFIRSLSLS